jgi:hypothetical protein
VKNGGPEGSCTLVAVRKDPSRRQRVAPLIELRIRNDLPRRSPLGTEYKARLRYSYGAAAFARYVAGEGWWEVLVTLQFVASSFV